MAELAVKLLLTSRIILASFIKDIQLDLKSFDESSKTGKNRAHDQIKLIETIQLHSEAKQLSNLAKPYDLWWVLCK